MAIKFSQFVVQTNASALSHIVGYNGADNIQITPADFINSFVPGGPFLPLSGGTMTGDLKLNDDIVAKFGTSDDLRIQHVSGGVSYIQNYTGDLQIQNRAADKDILFRADDGTGVVTTYFYLDGSATNMKVSKDMRFLDNVDAEFGTGGDFKIYHDSSNMYLEMINSGAGDIIIQNANDDSDITFKSDDGSGGTTEYFRVDGGVARTIFTRNTAHVDNAKAIFGNGDDLQIYHDGSNSFIRDIGTGDLKIQSNRLWIQSSTGEALGRFTENGSAELYYDNVLRLSTTSTGANVSGDLTVTGTITGSGGSYLPLAGGTMTGNLVIADNVQIEVGSGTGGDLNIFHDGTDSVIQNNTGDLEIQNRQDDGDVVFKSDDGSGGVAEYFRVDGTQQVNFFSKNAKFNDNVRCLFGGGNDLQIHHDGSNNYIQGVTGDMYIQNGANDKDIIFRSDDGSGGQTEYFRVDGQYDASVFTKNISAPDNVYIAVGSLSKDGDARFYHDGTNSYLQNETGELYIINNSDDKDILFQSDNGSGGIATYFFIDGSATQTTFQLDTRHNDSVKAKFGDSADLQIYHDGSNSVIKDSGTGNLVINAGSFVVSNAADTQNILIGVDGAEVRLYHNGSKKFETTSTGVKVTGVSEFADNTAAIAGGLTTGDVYRTGDLLKIVH